MSKETYNGWTNRETWLVNIYFGDGIREEVENTFTTDADLYDVAAHIENFIEDVLAEELENLSGFLKDYIDLGRINYYELAENYLDFF